MGDHVGLHDHEHLIGPARLVDADARRAAFGVARDDDAALGEGGGLKLLPDGAGRVVIGLRGVPDEEIIELPLQMVRQIPPTPLAGSCIRRAAPAHRDGRGRRTT